MWLFRVTAHVRAHQYLRTNSFLSVWSEWECRLAMIVKDEGRGSYFLLRMSELEQKEQTIICFYELVGSIPGQNKLRQLLPRTCQKEEKKIDPSTKHFSITYRASTKEIISEMYLKRYLRYWHSWYTIF